MAADKFYSDDPLQKEPSPRDAIVKNRKLNDYYDLLENSFSEEASVTRKVTSFELKG